MHDFRNDLILITGAASGIGAATARLLAERGAAGLVLVDRDSAALDALDLPCPVRRIAADVADEAMWDDLDLAGLSHAVVNAGIGEGKPIAETSLADWRRVMAVNLDGAFLTLRAAMRAIPSAGAIVVTASAAGIKAEPSIGAYGASKAAVLHLTRIAAREGAARGLRVNAIAPGGVETPIWRGIPLFDAMVAAQGEAAAFKAMAGAATPLGRFATAEEIALQIAFLLSEDAATMTGSVLVSDGGYSI